MNAIEKGLLAIRRITNETVNLVGGLEKFDHLQNLDLTCFLTEGINLDKGQLAFRTSPMSIRTTVRLKGASIEIGRSDAPR